MATSIVESGSYDLLIDTGFLVNAFVLDDTDKGVLNNTEYVLNGTTQYASVIEGSTNITVTRGRRDIGDQFTAGSMTFNLLDGYAGGVFNPFNQNSPFFDSSNDQPGLAPMRNVILTREFE
jgi:hypothetical protein